MKKNLFVLSLFFISTSTYTQPRQDTTFLRASVLQAENTYHSAMAKQSNIYNGRGYKEYVSVRDEHPYFINHDWFEGIILYETDLYTNVPLLFDLATEKVLIENPTNGRKMELATSKIELFQIHQHTFVNLTVYDSLTSEMEVGFYDRLYNGQLKLYAKRSKKFQERIKGNILFAEFDEKNKYFLFTGSQYIKVTNKASVIKALGGKKKLPKYSPQNRILIGNKAENSLIQLVEFYDSKMSL